MRQLTFIGKHQLEWQEVPDPKLEDASDAIVRPIAVATCDLDAGMLGGRVPVVGPFPFGHECVAEVIETGDDIRGFVRSERVVVPFQLSCGTCETCSRGHTGNCRSVPAGASYGLGSLGRNRAGHALRLLARAAGGSHAGEGARGCRARGDRQCKR